MMRKGWMLLLLLSLGLNIGLGVVALRTAASAGGDGPYPGREYSERRSGNRQHRADPETLAARRSRRLGHKLGLDDHQCDRLLRAQCEAIPALRDKRRSVAVARRELHEAMTRETLDNDQVWELSRRLNDAQSSLDSLVLATLIQEVESLSPEQRNAYFDRLPRWMHTPRDDPGPPLPSGTDRPE